MEGEVHRLDEYRANRPQFGRFAHGLGQLLVFPEASKTIDVRPCTEVELEPFGGISAAEHKNTEANNFPWLRESTGPVPTILQNREVHACLAFGKKGAEEFISDQTWGDITKIGIDEIMDNARRLHNLDPDIFNDICDSITEDIDEWLKEKKIKTIH